MELTRECNDCSICAAMNAAAALGVAADREVVKSAAQYNAAGGWHSQAVKALRVSIECYPTPNDLIWTPDPLREGVKVAKPEDNVPKLYAEYVRRLKAGRVAVTVQDMGVGNHCVALVGIRDGRIIVHCSLRGEYTIGPEEFIAFGHLQMALDTWWLSKAPQGDN